MTWLAIPIAAAAGGAIILWTIAQTVLRYAELPARIAYPKNYGDGGEMTVPKLVVWFLPVFQAAMACLVAWAFSRPDSHGNPLAGLVVIDIVLLVLSFVQRGVMLRPDRV